MQLALRISLAIISMQLSALAETPNIIMIMADDLGWGDVEFSQELSPGVTYAGNPVLQTPNLRAMTENGMQFNRFYAASAACSPTRASFLTGRHARRHNIDGPLFLNNDGKIRNRDLTVAELAKMQGYTTGHFGKWHVGSITKHTYDMRRGREGNYRHYSAPWNNGYDTTFGSENWMPTFDPYDNFPDMNAAQAAYFTGPSDAALTNRIPNDVRIDNKHESEIVTDQALDFIQQSHASGEPFMTTVWFATPHIPLIETPDTTYDGLGLSTDQRRYFEAITEMDRQIGRIREQLSDLGIADNTMLMFTSDNGPTDLSFGSTGGLNGRKSRLLEGGIRVPTVIEWQGRVDAGSSTRAMATTSDLVPTLLDIWGTQMPDDRPMDGESFLSVLDNGDQTRDDDYRFYSRHNSDRLAMDNTFKLFSSDSGGSFQLYDLINDPTEQNNLLAGFPSQAILDKRDELLADLNDWLVEIDASRLGADYSTRIVGNSDNVVVRADTDLELPFSQIGTDSFGAPIYEDKYQIIEGNSNFEQSDVVSLFIERQYAVLDAPLNVDSTGAAGSFDATSLPTGAVIDAGEVVHSFLVHFDPDISSGDESIQFEIEFEDQILGVIGDAGRLDDSDFLAFAEPVFETGNSFRGTLITEQADGGWSIGADGKSLTVNLLAGSGGIDQLRVITQAILESLFWSGDDTANWTTGSGADWDSDNDNLGDDFFDSGDNVVFDDRAASFNVAISGQVTPSAATFENTASSPYTLTGGSIGGTGRLTVKGGGAVTLSNGAHTYTGSTIVQSGTLALAGAATISGTPHILVESEGTLDVTAAAGGSYTLDNQTLTIDGVVDGSIVANNSSTVHFNAEEALNGDLTLQNGSIATGFGRISGNATIESGSVLQIGTDGSLPGATPLAPVTSSEDFQGFGTGLVFTNNTVAGSPAMPGWHFLDDAGSGQVTFVLDNESGDIVLKQTDPSFPEIDRGARAISPLQSNGTIDTITVDMRSDETAGVADRVIYFAYEDDDNFSYAIVRLDGTASFGDIENGFHTRQIPANNDFGSFSPDFAEFQLTHNAETGQVTLSVDGTLLYDFADPKFVGGAEGRIGIGTGNDAASFDDLVVTTETPLTPLIAELEIDGDYTQLSGATLKLDVYNSLRHDQLDVAGHFAAGGTLEVSLIADSPLPNLGDSIDVLDFATSSGIFDDYILPELSPGLSWNLSSLLDTGRLVVVIDGDFNADGAVNLADYTVWRDHLGQADATGVFDIADYQTWRLNFGNTSADFLSAFAKGTSVPEPGAVTTALVAVMGMYLMTRDQRRAGNVCILLGTH